MIYRIIYVVIAFLLSFLATTIFMPFLLKMCRRKGFYDMPDERKVHKNNIPRLGGILFIPAMLFGVGGAMIIGYREFSTSSLNMSAMFVIIGMCMLYLIGIIDDMVGMRASVKFLIQFIVAMFFPVCGLYIHNVYGLFGLYDLPIYLGYPLTILVTMLIVNAFNLIDGIDGLSSSLSMIAIGVFGCLYLKHGLVFYSLYCFGLVGSILGFFLYNMFGSVEKGTKTFMGDTGSLTLGYALSFLAIKYVMSNVVEQPTQLCQSALIVPFTLVAVPCFDLVRVAVTRVLRGVPMFAPDKTHIHHKCIQSGFTMRQSLLLIVLLQVVIGAANAAMILVGWNINVVIVIDIILFTLFHWWLNYRIKQHDAVQTKA